MEARTAAAMAAKAKIRDAARTRILNAAAEIFARDGRAGARMGEIAEQAGMPSATVHYYFGSKAALYEAVLTDMLDLWLREIEQIDEQGDPMAAIAAYIRAKMCVSFAHPAASRIVAREIMEGGVRIARFLERDLLPLLAGKLRAVEGWCGHGLLRAVDARHLFFLIWGATEFYANFAAEVAAVLSVSSVTEAEITLASDSVVDMILSGVRPCEGDKDTRSYHK